jgi:hypothetical protein
VQVFIGQPSITMQQPSDTEPGKPPISPNSKGKKKLLVVVKFFCMEECYFCLQNDCLSVGSDFKLIVGSYFMFVGSCLLVGFSYFCVQKIQRGGDSNPSWAPGPSLQGSFRD